MIEFLHHCRSSSLGSALLLFNVYIRELRKNVSLMRIHYELNVVFFNNLHYSVYKK